MMLTLIAVLIVLVALPSGLSEGTDENHQVDLSRYINVRYIKASLAISGGNAECRGSVLPVGTQSCTLIVKLYKKNGAYWNVLNTWITSAIGGNAATISRSVSVSSGTYKVVSTGNVDGENVTATSETINY